MNSSEKDQMIPSRSESARSNIQERSRVPGADFLGALRMVLIVMMQLQIRLSEGLGTWRAGTSS